MALSAMLFSLPLASCSDDDDYQPGPAVPEGNPSVYFPLQESYSFMFGSDEADKSFELTLKRLDASGEVSVPLILTSDVQGFTAPSEVKFEDGVNETKIRIDCSGLPTKQTYNVTLSIPESFSNPYVEGTDAVTVSSLVSDWELWAKDAVFSFTDFYGDVYSDIYAMPGTRKFKIQNFLGSGLDLPFEVDNPSASYSLIHPTYNADPYINYYPEDAFQCWYLYNQDLGDFPTWSPDGVSEPKITYALVYTYGDGTNYTYIRFAKKKGQVTIDTSYDDGSSSWQFISFTYGDPLFDMF